MNFVESRQLDKLPGSAGPNKRDHYLISRAFTDGLGRPLMTPYPMYRMAAAESTGGSPAAPSLEAGKQKVKVHVQAEIELSIN